MKNKILIAAYFLCLLTIVMGIEVIVTSDNMFEKILNGIIGFVSAIVIGGLWTRDQIGRKIAIYYFGVQILFSLFGIIMALIAIFAGEYTAGVVTLIITVAVITLYIFIIRGLNHPELLKEFN